MPEEWREQSSQDWREHSSLCILRSLWAGMRHLDIDSRIHNTTHALRHAKLDLSLLDTHADIHSVATTLSQGHYLHVLWSLGAAVTARAK